MQLPIAVIAVFISLPLIVESQVTTPATQTTPAESAEYGVDLTNSTGACTNFAAPLNVLQSIQSFPVVVKANGAVTIDTSNLLLNGTSNNLTGTVSGNGTIVSGGATTPVTFNLQPPGFTSFGLPYYPLTLTLSASNATCMVQGVVIPIGPLMPWQITFPAGVAEPISADTGELIEEPEADLSLGGPLPLEFRRYYGSLLALNGIMGALGGNWMSNFDVTAFVSGTSANVATFRGALIRFSFSNGVWTPSTNYRLGYQFQTVAIGFQFLDPASNLIFSFNTNGKLTGISDRNGNALTVTQGANGPTQVADGLGRTLTFTYTGSNLTKVQDQTGRSVSYTYSGSSLTAFIDANGRTASFSNTGAGLLTSLLSRTTKPAGNVGFSQTYDQNGRVISQLDGNGNTSSLVYSQTVLGDTAVSDALGNTWTQSQPNLFEFTGSLDPNNNFTATTYDANGRPISVVDRNGNTSPVTYHNPSGYLASSTDAQGNTTTSSYTASSSSGFTFYDLTGIQFADGTSVSYSRDPNGNLLNRTDATGKTTTFTYNTRGQPATVTNASGGVTTYSYGQDGTVAGVKSPAGDVTGYVYDSLKRLTQIKFADGTARSFTYDALDRVTQTTDERSKTTALAYTDNSEVSSVTDPLGNPVSFAYDSADNLTTVTTPSGATSTAYNQVSLPASIKAPTGETDSFTYDKLNRVTNVKDAVGQLAAFAYDHEGAVASVTDGANRLLLFGLDRLGRPLTATTPLSEVWRSNFDNRGRISSLQDALGQTTSFTYDANGLLSAVALPGSIQASFSRDALGNTSSITDPNGNAWARAFDTMGRFSSRTDPLGRSISVTYDQRNRVASATGSPGKVQFTYDAAGRLASALYGDGTNLTYTFDDANRLTGGNGVALTLDGNGAIVNSNGLAITRDASERITSILYPPGPVTYAYDQRGQLSQISDWTGATASFTYDGSLRMTAITRSNGVTTQYTYDADGNLSGITETHTGTGLSSISLFRDADGRIVTSNRNQPTTAAPAPGVLGLTHDTADQISGAAYDGLGRLTKDSIRGYQWDLASRLTSYSGSDGSASFTYDGLGSRISRNSQGVTQNFVINYALGLPSAAIVKNGSSDQRYYVYLPDGTLLYGIDAGGTVHHYFHFDESGNTLFLSK